MATRGLRRRFWVTRDTLLDLGFSDDDEKALAAEGSAEFARDSQRLRFSEPYQRITPCGSSCTRS
jgi:pyruvate, orthophosphate dikinase